MKGSSEELRSIPIWVNGRDNYLTDSSGLGLAISPDNPRFPLPPVIDAMSPPKFHRSQTIWWGEQSYWIDSLKHLSQAMEDGGRTITIDVKRIEPVLFDADGPAYKFLDAIQSVKEHEEYDGYKGVPRILLALLWKLQELSKP